MTTIEKIIQMQQQGMSDADIIKNLKNDGISPKEISDSLAQARIKLAVSQTPEPNGYQESSVPQNTQEQYFPQEQYQQTYQEQQYAPETQQYYAPEQSAMSIDTINDIVERIVSEKMKDTNQKIKTSTEFKIKTEEEIAEIKDRLKAIESVMDNLQKSIIGKVGEFGQSTTLIHKDLENLHGTVSKLMNPLIDNYNELKKSNDRYKQN